MSPLMGRLAPVIWDDVYSARETVEAALRRSVMTQAEKRHPKGGLLIMGASNCSPNQKVVQTLLSEERERVRSGFVRCC